MTTPKAPSPAPYPPTPFRETREEVLTDFIRRTVFGHLITAPDGSPLAFGAPFVLSREGKTWILEAHLARANPQALAASTPALVLFQGPDAYVRPGWYPSKARDGKAVPTWDYVSVQAKGRLEVIEDGAWLSRHLAALSTQQETPFADPWSPDDPPPGYVEALARGIVGLRLVVESLEGVWKLSQNHPVENRRGVVAGLRALEDEDARRIAEAIESGVLEN